MKIFKPIVALCTAIWWPLWSKWRWRKSFTFNVGIEETDKINKTSLDVQALIRKLIKKFHYTSDDYTELWDSLTPPSQLYVDYLAGKVEDDCDGFHSLVYHILSNSGIECYLLTANARKADHCILLCYVEGLWWVVDYSKLYNGFSTAKEAIENYNENFVTKYGAKSAVYNNSLLYYNYNKGRFYGIKLRKIEK